MTYIEKVLEAQAIISDFRFKARHVFDKAFSRYRSREYIMFCDAWYDEDTKKIWFEYWDGYDGENPPNAEDSFPVEWLDLNDEKLDEAASEFWEEH